MAKLPPPAVYEQEYAFWPWGALLEEVAHWVEVEAPKGAHIVDYMCGTGYLLAQIHGVRADLTLEGWDIDPAFAEYGQRQYPAANIGEGDALRRRPSKPPSVVLCTAGIHHLTRPEQQTFVTKVAAELQPDGWFVVGEEVVAEFADERGRRLALVALASALLRYAIERDAPPPVLEAAADVLANDLLERGEYKLPLSRLRSLLDPFFKVVAVRTIWNVDDSHAGDVIVFCRRRS